MSSLALCANGGDEIEEILDALEAVCARLSRAASRAFDRELRLARCGWRRKAFRKEETRAGGDANVASHALFALVENI